MKRFRRFRLYYDNNPIPFGEISDILELQLGYALIPLVNKEEEVRVSKKKDRPLLAEVTSCRNYFSAVYGIHLPAVHIRDNMCLGEDEYAIYMNGIEYGKGHVYTNHVFCIETNCVEQIIENKARKETYPFLEFEKEGYWIPEEDARSFAEVGYAILFPEQIIKAHLVEIIKKNITKVLNQNLVNQLIITVREINPDVVDDLFFTKEYTTSELKILLNSLLGRGISIRNMNTILETIADWINVCRDNEFLSEKVKDQLLVIEKNGNHSEKKRNEST